MSDINNSSSESIKPIEHDEKNIIHEQTNPSFHDTPEDNRNYKSLQTKPKSNFVLKPSLLTQKAEQIRTDKSAVIAAPPQSASRFLVLGDSRASPASSNDSNVALVSQSCPSGGFVFGEKILERVVQPESAGVKDDAGASGETAVKAFEDLIETGASDSGHDDRGGDDNNTDTEAALRRSADECGAHKSIALASSLEETEVVTGEENETSVLKTLCKLFLFASDRNEWIEKGFCNVHVNDTVDERVVTRSRLVVRSKGGLKVLVNTAIWAEMGLARASVKAVRITARSETGLQSFLLSMQNGADADSLFRAISVRKNRLANAGTQKNASGNSNSKAIDRKRNLSEDSSNDDGSDLIKKRIK